MAHSDCNISQKILIVGAGGMLGSMLFCELSKKGYDVLGTIRKRGNHPYFYQKNIVCGIDIRKNKDLQNVINYYEPNLIVNCAAITNTKRNIINAFQINTIFPHLLKHLCKKNARIIHYSTDAVYKKGNSARTEEAKISPNSIYGYTKFFGEITGENTLVLRTSMIGPELESKRHLLERLVNSQGKIYAGVNAEFSGLTTLEHASILINLIIPNNKITGIYNLGGESITKYALISKIAEIYALPIEVVPCSGIEGYRLDSEKFQTITGYVPPPWEVMLQDLKDYKWDIGG